MIGPLVAATSAPSLTRAVFLSRLKAILGDVRVLWVPSFGNTTTTLDDSPTNRVITWDADVAARLSALGLGAGQSFVAGSSQYGESPDTADLSFGNGAADQAMSFVAVAHVTDTSVFRNMLAKWAASNREYRFVIIDNPDKLALFLRDESAAAEPSRTSDAAITTGAWQVFGATYDGSGGATAADGITLYTNGSAIASTAANAAGYVAMEGLTAAFSVGTQLAHTANFFSGSLALGAICQKALSAADHADIVALCRQFFGPVF